MAGRPFAAATYDTRRVVPGSLLFCKGGFRSDYLTGIDGRGLAAYVAEEPYGDRTQAPGLIVGDVRKAMSLLAAEFHGHPERALTVIGITGTKGKTTTAYFTQAVLNAATHGRCALFSSVANCLDGRTYVESDLTTPESLDAFRMMREAVDHGMTHLVMEVSSQAYKVHRVHGLVFDVAGFLNFSPDHISGIEHPTLEDYLWCKRQIVRHCRTLVIGAGMAHERLVRQDAAACGVPVHAFATVRGSEGAGASIGAVASAGAGVSMAAVLDGDATGGFRMMAAAADGGDGSAASAATDAGAVDLGSFHLRIAGDFNAANAAAALALAREAGADLADPTVRHALETVTVPGRMETFVDPRSGTVAIVDYAHNFASVTALLDYVGERYGTARPRVTLVTGAAGDKAFDRRAEIVQAAQGRTARFVFTSEDTNTEPFEAICGQMRSYVTDPQAEVAVVVDRTAAIEDAVADARADAAAHGGRLNVLLVIGKGDERWIKDHGRHVPFEGDDRVIARLFAA